MQQCMQYAVEHNHEVKRASLELDNHRANKTAAVGRFLPAVSGSTGIQYNFGRAIDPETNLYTDVSTFYNGYSLGASLPVFDGFSRVHALKAAQASVMMGQSALRQRQDQTALSVLQAFTSVAYYEGLVKMAEEKKEETALLLRQTQVLEEVGRKSAADVALVESQKAEADYELTLQQNHLASALLELKKEMGYPLEKSLNPKTSRPTRPTSPTSPTPDPSRGGEGSIYSQGGKAAAELYTPLSTSPTPDPSSPTPDPSRGGEGRIYSQGGNDAAKLYPPLPPAGGAGGGAAAGAESSVFLFQMEVAKHEWRQARSALFPSLSLSAGLNTTYYHTLHSHTGQSFPEQFKNNMGQYVGATLSIPLFNRLQTVTSIRKAKNNYLIASEAYEQKLLEIEKLAREAWQDWQGYLKQTEQMTKKVEADSLAYQLTRRQYEEGLSTAIDLHATSSRLLNSKATLLQCQLMVVVKHELMRYYNGEQIW